MIEGLNPTPKRRWPRLALGLTALIALSGATGWGAAHLAAKTITSPDLAKVKAALKLRLPKTPIDAINCEGLGGLCEVASKTTLFYTDAHAKYLVIGRVYDMEARQDLTAARLLALNPDLLAAGAARRGGGDGEDAQPQTKSAPKQVSLAGLNIEGLGLAIPNPSFHLAVDVNIHVTHLHVPRGVAPDQAGALRLFPLMPAQTQ